MVGSRDQNGVDGLPFFVEQFAEVMIIGRLRILLELFGAAILIGVAERDDIFAGAIVSVARAFYAGADGGDIDLAVEILSANDCGESKRDGASGQGSGFYELTAA